jgi:hypothetical protein
MTLKVVGTGLGRTGTKSMQTALNMLGVGPCHHMVEVFQRPESMALWIAAAAGQPDWEGIFEGYQSVVDYPGAAHWRALVSYYPEARVLHTVRDADTWFDSTQATIFAPGSGALAESPATPFFQTVTGVFGDRIHDRAFMTDYFRRHTEAVIAEVPAERLLVFQVGEGWDRLCPFLGVPVPAEPFPSENSREAFQTRTKVLADTAIQSLDGGTS